jgi:hypothetical protein
MLIRAALLEDSVSATERMLKRLSARLIRLDYPHSMKANASKYGAAFLDPNRSRECLKVASSVAASQI